MKPLLTIGIDASNIRGGGGIKHLNEVLSNANPELFGIERVILWAACSASSEYPHRPWLEIIAVPEFEKSLLHRYFWRRFRLRKQVENRCHAIFVPGGISLTTTVPDVVMSQNMQPFVDEERKSVRWGKARVRLELLRYFQGRSLSRAKSRVFLTSYAKQTIQSQFPFPDSGNEEIPHGIDECFFVARPEPDACLTSASEFRIVYVSTINAYKHQAEVVDAIGQLVARWPCLSLTLVGGVYDSSYYARVASRSEKVNATCGRKVIEFVGKVPFSDLPEVYKNANLAVFASSCENLPNILLESMAATLPIVTSTYSPMPQVLGEGGVYCDVNSASSIAEAIESYLVSPVLRREKAELANKMAKKYSWKKASDSTFELLANVAKEYFDKSARNAGP